MQTKKNISKTLRLDICFHLSHPSSSILTDEFSFVFLLYLKNDLIAYLSILNIILVFLENDIVMEKYNKY